MAKGIFASMKLSRIFGAFFVLMMALATSAKHTLPTDRPIYPGPMLSDLSGTYIVSTNSASEFEHGGLLSLDSISRAAAGDDDGIVALPAPILAPVWLPSHGVQLKKLENGNILVLNQGAQTQITLIDPTEIKNRCPEMEVWCAPTASSPLTDVNSAHFEMADIEGVESIIISSVGSGLLEVVPFEGSRFGAHKTIDLDKWLLDKTYAKQERSQVRIRDFRILHGEGVQFFLALVEMPKKTLEGFESSDDGRLTKAQTYLAWAPITDILDEDTTPTFSFLNLTQKTGSKQGQKLEFAFESGAPESVLVFALMHAPDALIKITAQVDNNKLIFGSRIETANTCIRPLELSVGKPSHVSCMEDHTIVAYDLKTMDLLGRQKFFLSGPRSLQSIGNNRLLVGSMLGANLKVLESLDENGRASLKTLKQYFTSAPLNQPGGETIFGTRL